MKAAFYESDWTNSHSAGVDVAAEAVFFLFFLQNRTTLPGQKWSKEQKEHFPGTEIRAGRVSATAAES